ncbi:MAG TPA: hypothetical protein VIM42_00635 [Clostridium sp.]
MSVKTEKLESVKFSAKGILNSISEEGFHIEDEKTGDIEVLTLEDIRTLVGKSVTIAFANKEEVDD